MAGTAPPALPQSGDDLGFVPVGQQSGDQQQASSQDSDLGFTPVSSAPDSSEAAPPNFASGHLAEHLNVPPEAQPYTMPDGRMIDPATHTGGIPNPHAIAPTQNAMLPPGQMTAAPPPSFMDRVRNYVADSTPGKNLRLLGNQVYGSFGGGAGGQGNDSVADAAHAALREDGEPTPAPSAAYLDPDRYVQQAAAKASIYRPISGTKQVLEGAGNLAAATGFGGKSAMQLLKENPSWTPEQAVAESARQNSAGMSLDRAAKGANQIMSGAMEVGKPAIVYGVAAAPIKAAIYYVAGILAGKGAASIAAELGATPQEQESFNTLGFFIPSMLAGLVSVRTAAIPEGATVADPVTGGEVPVRGGVVGGTGFAAGVARSDTGGYAGQVRVGPYSVGVKFGRNAPEAPGGPARPAMGPGEQGAGPAEPVPPVAPVQDAVTSQRQAQESTVTDAAVREQEISLKAKQIVGLAPPPPPPPKPGEPGSKQAPMPAGLADGQISPQVVDDLGTGIQQLEPKDQPAAILEAKGKLARLMDTLKTVIVPGPKVVNVPSQKTADEEAANLINAEIEKKTQAAQDASKAQQEQQDAQQKQAEQQQKDAATAAQEREEARLAAETNEVPPLPDTPQMQKVRDALGTLPADATKADVILAARKAAGQVKLLLPYKLAAQLADEHIATRAQQEDAAVAGLSGQDMTPDQHPVALGKLATDVRNGKETFLHVQPTTKFKPSELTKENGFTATKVDKLDKDRPGGDETFLGTYYHPKGIRSKDVKQAASGPAPLAALRSLEAQWKASQAAQTPESQGRSVLAESPEQTQLGNPAAKTEAGTTGGKEPQEGEATTSAPGAQPVSSPSPEKPAHKYGSTQADIPPDSAAGKALAAIRAKIDPADLMGEGLVKDAHITVRYGIEDEDFDGIRAYLEKQEPFEARLGSVTSFPPSEHSDGAAPIVVAVGSSDLRRMEKELDQHGNFAERSFPDYRPHATIAYVKPDAAKKYVGHGELQGLTFTVRSVSISKRDGTVEEVELKGKAAPKQGEVGMMLAAGEVVLTATGRETTPFPKIDTSSDRKAGNTVKRVDQWLMENALAEAKARGDEFNARQFEHNQSNPSPADKDSAEVYLFDKDSVQPIPKPFTRPLTAPSSTGPAPGSWEYEHAVYLEAMKAARARGVSPNDTEAWGTAIAEEEARIEDERKGGKPEVVQSPVERPARTDQIGDQHKAEGKTEEAPAKIPQGVADFTAKMDPMIAKRVTDTLNSNRSFNGKLGRVGDEIERRVADGWTVQDSKTGRRFTGPDGRFLDEKSITKTGLNYADFLAKTKPVENEPVAPQVEKPEQKPAEVAQSSTANAQPQEKKTEIASPAVDWNNDESDVRAALDTKNWTPQNATQWNYQRRTNPTVKAFEKANRPAPDAALLATAKRPNPPQVAQPTKMGAVEFVNLNGKGDKTPLKGTEYIFPGFEEYHIAIVKPRGSIGAHNKLGWESFEVSTGRRIYGEPHQSSTEQKTIAGTLQQLKAHGKAKLDAAIEQGLKSPTAKSTVTADKEALEKTKAEVVEAQKKFSQDVNTPGTPAYNATHPTNTYEAEVSKYAGDPHPKMVQIQAENRRHAEQLLAEKHPGMRISSAGRVDTAPKYLKRFDLGNGTEARMYQMNDGRYAVAVWDTDADKSVSIVSYPTEEQATKAFEKGTSQSVTFKPGQKVMVKGADGTEKPDEVRIVLPNKKVVLKGQRKPVSIEDVSPAEKAVAEHRAAHVPGTFAQLVIDHGKAADKLVALMKDPKADPAGLAEAAAKVDELAPEVEKEVPGGGPIYAEDYGYKPQTRPAAPVKPEGDDITIGEEVEALTKELADARAEAAKAPKPKSDLGGTFYANPLDPALAKRLILDPLARAAEPLREALAQRGDVTHVANTVHDLLQNVDRTNKATTLQMKDVAKVMADPKFTHEDAVQVRDNIEDPEVPLTRVQTELRDREILPLDGLTRNKYIATQLIKSGKFKLDDILEGKVPQEEIDKVVPPETDYQHRIPVGKNTLPEKLVEKRASTFHASGGKLSRSFASEKATTFREIHGPNGEREAVAVKGGRVIQFVNGDNAEVLDGKLAEVKQKLNQERQSETPDEERIDNLQRQVDELNTQKRTVAEGGRAVVDMGPHREGFVTTEQLADEAVAPLEKKLAALQNEFAILHGSQKRAIASQQRIENLYYQIDGLEKQITAIRASVGPEEQAKAGLTDADLLAQHEADIAALEKRVEKLQERQQKLAGTEGRSPAQERELKNIPGHIQEAQAKIDSIRESALSQNLEGRYWQDKNGGLWKFDRGTTKFISDRTGQPYFNDARLTSLVNHMEVSKALNAAVALERTKSLLEANNMALKVDNPKNAPEGWKPTGLPQFRNYYFPEKIADTLDQFHFKQMHDANIFEQVNSMLLQFVLMNPGIHWKNIVSNFAVGKASEFFAGKGIAPRWYGDQVSAGTEAANVLRDMGGKEYQRLLGQVGLDLRGADASFDATTKDIIRQWAAELEGRPADNKVMSALVGVKDAAKFLQKWNHALTFGLGDAATLQSFYAKRAELIRNGMDTDTAETAAKNYVHQVGVGEYTTPAQVAGSSKLARVFDTPSLSAFWPYHFGYLFRPLAKAVGDAVLPDSVRFRPDEEASEQTGETVNNMGQTPREQRAVAILRLAVLLLFATQIKPMLDRMTKKITGDPNAEFPIGGLLGFTSKAYEAAKDQHNLLKGGAAGAATMAGELVMPSPTLRAAVGLVSNYDTFTGRYVRNPNDDLQEQAKQVGLWLAKGTYPAQLQGAAAHGGWQKVVEKLAGVAFPLHDGMKAAMEIRSDERGKLPSDPQASRVFQSIMAAAEQAHQSQGQDTSLQEALLASGQLSDAQKTTLAEAVAEAPIVFAVRGLGHPQDVWRVFQRSTRDEQAALLQDDESVRKMSDWEDALRSDEKTDEADKIRDILMAR